MNITNAARVLVARTSRHDAVNRLADRLVARRPENVTFRGEVMRRNDTTGRCLLLYTYETGLEEDCTVLAALAVCDALEGTDRAADVETLLVEADDAASRRGEVRR